MTMEFPKSRVYPVLAGSSGEHGLSQEGANRSSHPLDQPSQVASHSGQGSGLYPTLPREKHGGKLNISSSQVPAPTASPSSSGEWELLDDNGQEQGRVGRAPGAQEGVHAASLQVEGSDGGNAHSQQQGGKASPIQRAASSPSMHTAHSGLSSPHALHPAPGQSGQPSQPVQAGLPGHSSDTAAALAQEREGLHKCFWPGCDVEFTGYSQLMQHFWDTHELPDPASFPSPSAPPEEFSPLPALVVGEAQGQVQGHGEAKHQCPACAAPLISDEHMRVHMALAHPLPASPAPVTTPPVTPTPNTLRTRVETGAAAVVGWAQSKAQQAATTVQTTAEGVCSAVQQASGFVDSTVLQPVASTTHTAVASVSKAVSQAKDSVTERVTSLDRRTRPARAAAGVWLSQNGVPVAVGFAAGFVAIIATRQAVRAYRASRAQAQSMGACAAALQSAAGLAGAAAVAADQTGETSPYWRFKWRWPSCDTTACTPGPTPGPTRGSISSSITTTACGSDGGSAVALVAGTPAAVVEGITAAAAATPTPIPGDELAAAMEAAGGPTTTTGVAAAAVGKFAQALHAGTKAMAAGLSGVAEKASKVVRGLPQPDLAGAAPSLSGMREAVCSATTTSTSTATLQDALSLSLSGPPAGCTCKGCVPDASTVLAAPAAAAMVAAAEGATQAGAVAPSTPITEAGEGLYARLLAALARKSHAQPVPTTTGTSPAVAETVAGTANAVTETVGSVVNANGAVVPNVTHAGAVPTPAPTPAPATALDPTTVFAGSLAPDAVEDPAAASWVESLRYAIW